MYVLSSRLKGAFTYVIFVQQTVGMDEATLRHTLYLLANPGLLNLGQHSLIPCSN